MNKNDNIFFVVDLKLSKYLPGYFLFPGSAIKKMA